jgi:MOSC domain-containing protein YiiM
LVHGPRVESVNVGVPRTVEWQGRSVTSAIWKAPVDGPVRVAGVNLVGDDQADRRVHGGTDKAVYAYAIEDYEWWAGQGVAPVGPGTFGENLTTAGLDVSAARVGDRWRIGATLLEVAQPREPCFKLGIRMGDGHFPGRFEAARRPGAYLRIIEEGELVAGDPIDVAPASSPAVTLGSMVTEPLDLALLRQIAADDRMSAGWRIRAERALTR